MVRQYQEENVYEALQERFHFLFREFENIYVSFSGGKDSGVLLNLLLDFKREHYPERLIGLFHQDFEAQYTMTTEYVERTFQKLEKEVDPYWVCLPMATRTALSSYEMYWYPWDDMKRDIWVRPMPEHPYVIKLPDPFHHYRCRRRISPNSSADITKNSMETARRYACLECGQKNPCSVTADF